MSSSLSEQMKIKRKSPGKIQVTEKRALESRKKKKEKSLKSMAGILTVHVLERLQKFQWRAIVDRF